MHKIYANIDKNAIDRMPTEHFDGRIITISTVAEADKATKYLEQFPIIGIDTGGHSSW